MSVWTSCEKSIAEQPGVIKALEKIDLDANRRAVTRATHLPRLPCAQDGWCRGECGELSSFQLYPHVYQPHPVCHGCGRFCVTQHHVHMGHLKHNDTERNLSRYTAPFKYQASFTTCILRRLSTSRIFPVQASNSSNRARYLHDQ